MTDWISVAVCGAHMSGLPLNPQLTSLGAQMEARTTTAPHYRFYKLNGFEPPRPGLVRVAQDGAPIEVEVWRMPVENYGRFVALIPAPLCIGNVELQDGSCVQGFLCEKYATENAVDISTLGGWRGYLSGLEK